MKHINSTIHWWYDIIVVIYPFAKIQIFASFDPWKEKPQMPLRKYPHQYWSTYRATCHRERKDWDRKIKHLNFSLPVFLPKQRKGAESMGNNHKLDKFFMSAMTSEPRLVVNESHVHLWAVCWQSSLANVFVAQVLFLAVTIDTN